MEWNVEEGYLHDRLNFPNIFTDHTISDTVKVHIKSRNVTVEGPRGKLSKDLSHLAVNFSKPKKNVINIEIHHGSRKNVATLRTVRTHINNLIIGVTKGYKYKMRYVYAHFPINVNIEKNNETGNVDVEIRYVHLDLGFWIGIWIRIKISMRGRC